MAALWIGKPADLFLYAVPVFENYPPIWSHPKQADTSISGYGLDWKWAFSACFHENDNFHAQNWVYKFGHGYILWRVLWWTPTGPMYFVFCRLYPSSPCPLATTAVLGSYIVFSLFLTIFVSPAWACLSIWLERFRESQKEDKRGPLSI